MLTDRTRTGLGALSLIIISLVAAPEARAETQIEALGGTYKEAITGIEAKGGKLMVKTARRSLPLESVKAIRFHRLARYAKRSSKLVLTNGDSLRGSIEGGTEDHLGLRSTSLGSLKVPLELVRAIIPAGVGAEKERSLEKLLKKDDEIDWIRLKNGGIVRGSISKIDGARVTIDTNTEGGSNMGSLAFAFSKVALVAIAPLGDPPKKPKGLSVVVRLGDGSVLRGTLKGLSDGKLSLSHPLGGKKALVLGLTRVSELTVQNGLFVYLSDIDPSETDQKFPAEYTYEVEIWGFKRDRNVTGGKLRLNGRVYPKGLGVHSYCKLSYKLGGKFAEFRAVVGLDDSTRYLGEPGFGGAVFKVLLDGKPAREYPSGIAKRKGQKPTSILVDVKGKNTLTIIADYDPTSLHVLGRADWADAHLIKKR